MKEIVLTKAAGVYRIFNVVTGHVYIGGTKNLENRKHKHFSALRRNGHRNGNLQQAWRDFGEGAFQFEVLELVAVPSDLLQREQHHLDIVFACGIQYNLSPTAGNNRGFRHSPESREQMSLAKAGGVRGPLPEATRRRIGEALRGRSASETHVENNRLSRIGSRATEETKMKMSQARKGRPKSEETKARIGAAVRLRAEQKRLAKGMP